MGHTKGDTSRRKDVTEGRERVAGRSPLPGPCGAAAAAASRLTPTPPMDWMIRRMPSEYRVEGARYVEVRPYGITAGDCGRHAVGSSACYWAGMSAGAIPTV